MNIPNTPELESSSAYEWEEGDMVRNSRRQPTQIGLGAGAYSQSLLKLEYEYGATASVNNGNVTKQTITVPGVTHAFIQNYTYDELNRLKIAEETQNSTQTWKQTFTFDRYGNRNFDEANTTTLAKNCGSAPNYSVCSADVPIVNPSVNTANNKLNGTTYDAAGNVIEDAEGREFMYDAENKQVEVENGSSQLIGQYYFDGDGKRVKKVVPNGETTIFVYDASGRLIGEYSTEVQPSQDAKIQYLTADHLGTPRINTNSVGAVVSRSDYMPYGEEITIGRSSGQGYFVDDVRQGFTGYENDDETGLDYAQARMYAKGLGRFTGSDPYSINLEVQYAQDYKEANKLLLAYLLKPLQWNRYSYVSNNPLVYVDPSGQKEEIYAHINIVYDKHTVETEEKARKLTAKTVADAMKVYKAAGITLVVTYTKGDASSNSVLGDPNQHITEGKVTGALNVFVSNDMKHYSGGASNTTSGESFINYGSAITISGAPVPREPDVGILAHEIGHHFGFPSENLAHNTVTDAKIEAANASLRAGQTRVIEFVPPVSGRNSTHVSQPRRSGRVDRGELPAINLYRAGAQRYRIKV